MTDYEKVFDKISQTVLTEHAAVLERIEKKSIACLMDQIKSANRIFVAGVGREGIAARGFSMRLMHLGKETHWIWDDTTPGMHKGDLLIIVNGSGRIGHLLYVAEQAKIAKATVFTVTGSPNDDLNKLTDNILFVPACVFNGEDPRAVDSILPMGSLFEEATFMIYDIVALMLEKELDLSHSDMEMNHRNIE